jgi:hypothetical protein
VGVCAVRLNGTPERTKMKVPDEFDRPSKGEEVRMRQKERPTSKDEAGPEENAEREGQLFSPANIATECC